MTLSIGKRTQVSRKTTHRISLSGSDIYHLLREHGLDVPDNASVVFCVPGGGDWSNVALDVDEENPVEVTWTVQEDTES